ncbi:hypothetical protein [Kitasatospora sp. KL5]|uniref:tetratricopeptide repeat protein n=1 Tax=Kitasatospora sp. KL5 TaxID=3425125 RepID=UPI003D6F5729
MDAEDLDYRERTRAGGWIPPELVSRLVELGHVGEVELQARGGDWSCVREWVRILDGQDRRDEALEMLAPYVATGWWQAAETVAGLLERRGRAEEAVALARPYAEAGDRSALQYFARLLARHGRGEEAFDLLRPHLEDWFLATALVDVAADADRDEEAAALLAARIETPRRCGNPCDCRNIEPSNAVGLLAGIRERQGRVDEAIALLHTREITSVNNRDQLADLLARHNRLEELRQYAATEHLGHAVRRLAELLEDRGDLNGAIEVYRQHADDSSTCPVSSAVQLALLLGRHGRGTEAIDVMLALADGPVGADDWIVDMLCGLYADHGRAEDGLAYLDGLKARRGAEDWEYFRCRLPLLTALGRREQAIEEARAHPEANTWYAAWSVAKLLADAGRAEEAVALLEEHPSANRNALAAQLVELGRIKDAVAVLHRPEPAVSFSSHGSWTDCPPF